MLCPLFIKAFSRFIAFIMRVSILNWSHFTFWARDLAKWSLLILWWSSKPQCSASIYITMTKILDTINLTAIAYCDVSLNVNVKKRPKQFRLKSDERVYRWSPSNGYISPSHFLSYALIFVWMPLSHAQGFYTRMITTLWYSIPPSK